MIFKLGLESMCFWTALPCLQQVNLTWARDATENWQAIDHNMDVQYQIKEGRYKPRLYVSINLLV